MKLIPITEPLKEKYDPSPRARMPRLETRERVKSFAEVRLGFTEEMVAQEAKRCMSCGTCCIQSCPYDAITFNGTTGSRPLQESGVVGYPALGVFGFLSIVSILRDVHAAPLLAGFSQDARPLASFRDIDKAHQDGATARGHHVGTM